MEESKAKFNVKGVCFEKRRKKWQASVKMHGKSIFLGYFEDQNEAIKARLEYEASEEYQSYKLKKHSQKKAYDEKVIDLHSNGYSCKEIAEYCGKDQSTISEKLKKLGLKIESRIILDNKSIVNNYLSGETIEKISKDLNVSHWIISRILAEEKIEIRKNRKYFFDESCMEELDEEWKAYFLGLLLADGCIRKDSLVIKLSLSKKDEEILLPIAEKLDLHLKYSESKKVYSKKTNKYYNNSEMAHLIICSKKICLDLSKYGCTPNKSLILKWPTNVSDSMINHFIRGYFDGDGWITHTTFGIISSLEFCIGLQKFFNEKLAIKSYIVNAGKVYRLLVHKRSSIQKLYNFIYNDSSIFLNRKKNKFHNLANKILKIQRK